MITGLAMSFGITIWLTGIPTHKRVRTRTWDKPHEVRTSEEFQGHNFSLLPCRAQPCTRKVITDHQDACACLHILTYCAISAFSVFSGKCEELQGILNGSLSLSWQHFFSTSRLLSWLRHGTITYVHISQTSHPFSSCHENVLKLHSGPKWPLEINVFNQVRTQSVLHNRSRFQAFFTSGSNCKKNC